MVLQWIFLYYKNKKGLKQTGNDPCLWQVEKNLRWMISPPAMLRMKVYANIYQ